MRRGREKGATAKYLTRPAAPLHRVVPGGRMPDMVLTPRPYRGERDLEAMRRLLISAGEGAYRAGYLHAGDAVRPYDPSWNFACRGFSEVWLHAGRGCPPSPTVATCLDTFSHG